MIYGEMEQSLDFNGGKYFTYLDNTYYIGDYAISNTVPLGMKAFYPTQRIKVYTLFNVVYQIEAYGKDETYYVISDEDYAYSKNKSNRDLKKMKQFIKGVPPPPKKARGAVIKCGML